VNDLSGLEVSEIASDVSNASCMLLEETSTADLAEEDGVFETTRDVWYQDIIMHQVIWVFDPGKDERSSWSDYGLGIVFLADASVGGRQPVAPRSLAKSKSVWQGAIGSGDEPWITPSVNDPPWVDAWGALESLVATSVWWRAMKPAGFEGRFLQVTSEANTLLSVWGSNQARAEDGERSASGVIIGNIVPQTRCMEPLLLFSRVVGDVTE